MEKIIGSDAIIEKAYEELNRFNWSEKEFIAYEQEIKRIRDEKAVLAQKLDDARDEGRHEGRKEGREEGIKIGEEMGKIEGKVEVAKNLLKAGISIDVISQTTDLSHDEINQLQEDSAL